MEYPYHIAHRRRRVADILEIGRKYIGVVVGGKEQDSTKKPPLFLLPVEERLLDFRWASVGIAPTFSYYRPYKLRRTSPI